MLYKLPFIRWTDGIWGKTLIDLSARVCVLVFRDFTGINYMCQVTPPIRGLVADETRPLWLVHTKIKFANDWFQTGFQLASVAILIWCEWVIRSTTVTHQRPTWCWHCVLSLKPTNLLTLWSDIYGHVISQSSWNIQRISCMWIFPHVVASWLLVVNQ